MFDRCHNLIAVHEVHIDNGSFTMSEEPVNDTRNNRDCAADSARSMMTNNLSRMEPSSSGQLFVHYVISEIGPHRRMHDSCCQTDVEVTSRRDGVVGPIRSAEGDCHR